MMRFIRSLLENVDGAVAPIVALSLIGLIAAGGIAFDYAHLAAMDTELQDAADHAALAAATQLDGTDGAQDRATQAANELIANETRFAKKDSTHTGTVAIAQVTFYQAYTSASSNTPADDGDDANTKAVKVAVEVRAADYALTPIVGAAFGSLDAKAVAGIVDSAVCGVVPFFVCNPAEPTTNKDQLFAIGGLDPGTGVVMAQGGTQWGPGNFGFLDQLGNGANSVAEALASNSIFGKCQQTSNVVTETGNILNAVRDSLNMRFDFDPGNASACKNPPCSASSNVIKDAGKPTSGSKTCQNWVQLPQVLADVTTNATPPRYFPRATTGNLSAGVTPKVMGSPRDICHYFMNASGNYPLCANNRMGDGVWDRAAYFRTNHPTTNYLTDPELGANVTRYQTYLWEAEDPSRLPATTVGTNKAWGAPQCILPGLAPDPAGIDRRRITAAVVNCHAAPALNGKKTLKVAGFVDVFLVEPSIARTRCTGAGCGSTFTMNGGTYQNAYGSNNDIYVEVIGASGTGQGGQVPQITRRDIPKLIE